MVQVIVAPKKQYYAELAERLRQDDSVIGFCIGVNYNRKRESRTEERLTLVEEGRLFVRRWFMIFTEFSPTWVGCEGAHP